MNVAQTFKCYISKSKLSLSEYNKNLFECNNFYSFYVTLNQTAQVFFGTPGSLNFIWNIQNHYFFGFENLEHLPNQLLSM